MAGRFEELLKKAQAEKRAKLGDEPLPEEQPTPVSEDVPEEQTEAVVEEEVNETEKVTLDAPRHANRKKGVAKIIVPIVLALTVVAFLCVTIVGILDFAAFGKSETKIAVEIPAGTSNDGVAAILHENGLIDHPWIFWVYSKVSGQGNRYQAGTYELSASMGYDGIANILVAGNPREEVTVTIPEGLTIDKIAERLEQAGVCSSKDFYDALNNETYDFDFINEIPQLDDEGYEGRLYRLEGYLFPDTYQFFKDSDAKDVVSRFLENFDSKFTDSMRRALKEQGLTLDDVVIMASIAEKEAASDKEMPKITRILYNRLESNYTRLECDSTELYIQDLPANIANADEIIAAYDTYQRFGLPVGPIGNPGEVALKAAIYPSDDSYIAQCYYFANDDKGVTYYSKTFEQHKAACREHGIGIYGK